MITESMIKIMEQIKELDPDYEFITDDKRKEYQLDNIDKLKKELI